MKISHFIEFAYGINYKLKWCFDYPTCKKVIIIFYFKI